MKKKNLLGQTFGKLTVVSEETTMKYNDTRAHWNCQCECGELVVVDTNHLTTGNTKSCGCWKIEVMSDPTKLRKFTISNKKFEPHITSARRLWKQYCYQDKQCNITFDQWFAFSQKPCSYCGIEKYNEYNCFIFKKDASQEAINNGNFSYNGLDRIDNSLPHKLNNVVTSCWVCNRAKNERTAEEFYQYISRLKPDNIFVPLNELLRLPSNYLLVSIKCAFRHYKRNYGEIEIDLQTFYTYSQLPCFYCGEEKSNYFNVYLKDKKASQTAKDGAHFYYNGIDRLDNTKTHTIDNIVPCCYYCNFAKSKLALPEFQAWIRRVQDFQKSRLLANEVLINNAKIA
jgi:5-methylcytosine-specific restriction endonuclease McrA